MAACADSSAPLAPDAGVAGWSRKIVRIRITPDTVVVSPGKTMAFTASGVFSDGRSKPVAVSWKATGGTIDSAGAFTAGTTPGEYSVAATTTTQQLADTASVTVPDTVVSDTAVSVKEPVASVSVTLGSASLTVGQITQATATAYDTSGQPLTGRPMTMSSSNNAVATVSASGLVTAVAAGTAAILATSEGQSGSANITVMAPLPGGTPSPCVGTTINPGDDWSAKVSAGTTGTVFCIKAGTHRQQSVVPKNGQQFLGEPGAIMDGEGATAFAFSGSATSVVIRHLVIQRYTPPDGAKAMIHGDAGRGWVVDSNEIAYSSQQGVRVGDQGRIRWNYIHHNGIMGIGLYKADSVLIEGNHLVANPRTFVDESGATARASQMKIFTTVGVVIRNNLVEDGPKKGIWLDTDNYLALVEGNTIRRQGQAGVWYEANYDGVIRNNTVAGCGTADNSSWVSNAGIQVTNSQPVEIARNTISGCENGITGMSVAATSGHQYYSGSRGLKALGMNVHDNTVIQPTGKIGVRATGIADSVFHNGRIRWQDNSYILTGNAAPFTWLNENETKAQWQALGFDTRGIFTP